MNHGNLGGWLFFLAMVILFLGVLLLIMSPPVTSTRRGPFGWWKK